MLDNVRRSLKLVLKDVEPLEDLNSYSFIKLAFQKDHCKAFPGNPVVRAPKFPTTGDPVLIPGQGSLIPQVQ